MTRSDHGTAQDAMDYAFGELPGCDTFQFLCDWRYDQAARWSEFYTWLDEQRIDALVETSGLAEHSVRRSYMESVR